MKKIVSLMAILALTLSSWAQEKEFANYSVAITTSPFGGGMNFGYNFNEKTSLNVAVGGAPTGELVDQDSIEELGDYNFRAQSSWMGMFINHRPFEQAKWFVFATGIGIGNIKSDFVTSDGAAYTANYQENPVGYFGFAARTQNVKGMQFGFDVGALYTSGAQVIGPDASRVRAIEEHMNSVLPNVQISIGFGF